MQALTEGKPRFEIKYLSVTANFSINSRLWGNIRFSNDDAGVVFLGDPLAPTALSFGGVQMMMGVYTSGVQPADVPYIMEDRGD